MSYRRVTRYINVFHFEGFMNMQQLRGETTIGLKKRFLVLA